MESKGRKFLVKSRDKNPVMFLKDKVHKSRSDFDKYALDLMFYTFGRNYCRMGEIESAGVENAGVENGGGNRKGGK